MMPDDQWLAAVWPFVRGQLPSSPARVLEVAVGRWAAFVPVLLDGGYQAVGVDHEAPDGSNYHQVKLERYAAPQPVVEWAWERFDEATARWCFARLTPPAPEAEPGWMRGSAAGSVPRDRTSSPT